MGAEFAAALRRHSREVANLEGAHAAEFLRLLKATQERLAGRYASLGALGDPLDAFRLRAMIGETQAAIATLEAKAGGLYDTAAKESVDLAVGHIGDELDMLSVAFDDKPLDVAIDAQAVLADPAQGLLADHFATSVERYGGELLNGVRRELFVGMRGASTIGQTVQNIAGRAGPFGQVGRSNAERLVRTEVSQAYGAAHHGAAKEAAKAIPALKKVWLHIGSYQCPVCGPLHGTERALDGTWTIKLGKRTRQVAHPPGHPNCCCRMSSMKPGWREGLEKLGYLGEQPDAGEAGAAAL